MDRADLDSLFEMLESDELAADLGADTDPQEAQERGVFRLTPSQAASLFMLVAESLGESDPGKTARVLGSMPRCREYESWLRQLFDGVVAEAHRAGWTQAGDDQWP